MSARSTGCSANNSYRLTSLVSPAPRPQRSPASLAKRRSVRTLSNDEARAGLSISQSAHTSSARPDAGCHARLDASPHAIQTSALLGGSGVTRRSPCAATSRRIRPGPIVVTSGNNRRGRWRTVHGDSVEARCTGGKHACSTVSERSRSMSPTRRMTKPPRSSRRFTTKAVGAYGALGLRDRLCWRRHQLQANGIAYGQAVSRVGLTALAVSTRQ